MHSPYRPEDWRTSRAGLVYDLLDRRAILGESGNRGIGLVKMFQADRGTTATATTSASMRSAMAASENGQIRRSTFGYRGYGSCPHLASALRECRSNGNIHTGSGVIVGESRLEWPQGRSSIPEFGANLHGFGLPVGCLCGDRYCGRARLRDSRGWASAADAGHRRGPHTVAAGCIRAVAFGGGALAQIARPPMTRSHRSVHRVLWPVLALAVALGFSLALDLRPPPGEAPAAEAQPP
jgi:hypothetical protein